MIQPIGCAPSDFYRCALFQVVIPDNLLILDSLVVGEISEELAQIGSSFPDAAFDSPRLSFRDFWLSHLPRVIVFYRAILKKLGVTI